MNLSEFRKVIEEQSVVISKELWRLEILAGAFHTAGNETASNKIRLAIGNIGSGMDVIEGSFDQYAKKLFSDSQAEFGNVLSAVARASQGEVDDAGE